MSTRHSKAILLEVCKLVFQLESTRFLHNLVATKQFLGPLDSANLRNIAKRVFQLQTERFEQLLTPQTLET